MRKRMVFLTQVTLALGLTLSIFTGPNPPQAVAFQARFASSSRIRRMALAGLAEHMFTPANAAFGSPAVGAGDEGERYKFVRKWGAQAPPGTFTGAQSVAVDKSGNIFVADCFNSRIEKFDAAGKFLLQWGKPGHRTGEFWLPQGLALDANGNVFVADTYNSRIQEFTNSCAFINAWGSHGSGEGRTPDLGDEFMRRPSSDRNGVPRNPQSVH